MDPNPILVYHFESNLCINAVVYADHMHGAQQAIRRCNLGGCDCIAHHFCKANTTLMWLALAKRVQVMRSLAIPGATIAVY